MHIPVFLEEVLDVLNPQPGQTFVDMTLGLGGHAGQILKHILPDGILIGFEHDVRNAEIAKRNLQQFSSSFICIPKNFSTLKEELSKRNVKGVDGILFDLGVSSLHLDDPERGFSFKKDGPLDMRMNLDLKVTAADMVNTASEESLSQIFQEYGEEKRHRFYARKIVERRNRKSFSSTRGLSDFIIAHSPGKKKHPAKLIFQALRIAVNDELGHLAKVLPDAISALKPGGRIAVISFHSLEDRMVKNFFRSQSEPPQKKQKYPHYQDKNISSFPLRLLTKRAILPSREEIEKNPRARSARMRVAERT